MAEGNDSKTKTICAICLGQISIRSRPDTCMHEYCFSCLFEMSIYKQKCPLCNIKFKSIVHNDKSTGAYEEFQINDDSNDNDSDSDSNTSQSSSSSPD